MQQQWKDGRVTAWPDTPLVIFPKTQRSTLPIISDARFRRALLYAIDRQQLVDSFMGGQTSIDHSVIRLPQSDTAALESSIVRYDHDPRRAAELLEELGYRRDGEGNYRDGTNQPLAFSFHTDVSNDIQPKLMLAVRDQWARLGIAIEPIITTAQELVQGPQWQSNFSAFSLRKTPMDLSNVERYFHSGQIPFPENRFAGANYPAYASQPLDTLVERYSVTIASAERLNLVGQIVNHITDQVVIMGLFFDVQPTLISKHVLNVPGRTADAYNGWNAWEWEPAS